MHIIVSMDPESQDYKVQVPLLLDCSNDCSLESSRRRSSGFVSSTSSANGTPPQPANHLELSGSGATIGGGAFYSRLSAAPFVPTAAPDHHSEDGSMVDSLCPSEPRHQHYDPNDRQPQPQQQQSEEFIPTQVPPRLPLPKRYQHNPYAQPQSLGQQQHHDATAYVEPNAHGLPSVTVGCQPQMPPRNQEVKVGVAAMSTTTATRTTHMMAMPPPVPLGGSSTSTLSSSVSSHSSSNSTVGSPRAFSSSSVGGSVAASSRGSVPLLQAQGGRTAVGELLKAIRDKKKLSEKNQLATGHAVEKKRERTRAGEGPIPTCQFITMGTPFFIAEHTPVLICSSSDGVWHGGFSWRDNTRRVTLSTLASGQSPTEGPTFKRNADVALYDSQGRHCDMDSCLTRACYIMVDPRSASCGVNGDITSASVYWRQGDSMSQVAFVGIPVANLNWLLLCQHKQGMFA